MFNYVSLFKSFRVQFFFIFKFFRVKVLSHVRYHFMSNIVLIKCCTTNVVPFLFIYVKCHVILINCFTFKYCLVPNFIRVYFISYMSHWCGYLNLFIFVFLGPSPSAQGPTRTTQAQFTQGHQAFLSTPLAWLVRPSPMHACGLSPNCMVLTQPSLHFHKHI